MSRFISTCEEHVYVLVCVEVCVWAVGGYRVGLGSEWVGKTQKYFKQRRYGQFMLL